MEIFKKLKELVLGLSPSSSQGTQKKKSKETIRDEMRKKYIRSTGRRRHPQSHSRKKPFRKKGDFGTQKREDGRQPSGRRERPYRKRRPRRGPNRSGNRPPRPPVREVQPQARNTAKPSARPAGPRSQRIGVVTHYFSKVHAAIVKLEQGSVKCGDQIQFMGNHAVINITIRSLQINRIPVEEGRPGEEVGIEVKSHVREGDKVYKIINS